MHTILNVNVGDWMEQVPVDHESLPEVAKLLTNNTETTVYDWMPLVEGKLKVSEINEYLKENF